MAVSKFYIISAECRTGSTWLANYLGGLPGVFAFHDGINGCHTIQDYKDRMNRACGRYSTIVDVTTVPDNILTSLCESMETQPVRRIDTPLFQLDSNDLFSLIWEICGEIGVGFYPERFQELIQYRVNSIPEMVDIEAGISICKELGLIEREENDEQRD